MQFFQLAAIVLAFALGPAAAIPTYEEAWCKSGTYKCGLTSNGTSYVSVCSAEQRWLLDAVCPVSETCHKDAAGGCTCS
ncbi:hypothetical protein GGR56DRAFT_614085 [Xylariaceae sp. FL0804]|nr:hypothetical protein GGR56DRAFT_614085 [Xylariaceae sp. FL0804]